jgi:hypothetical protein
MLPSSALPADAVQGEGDPWVGGKSENRILLLPCPPNGWQKMVSGVALFEEV